MNTFHIYRDAFEKPRLLVTGKFHNFQQFQVLLDQAEAFWGKNQTIPKNLLISTAVLISTQTLLKSIVDSKYFRVLAIGSEKKEQSLPTNLVGAVVIDPSLPSNIFYQYYTSIVQEMLTFLFPNSPITVHFKKIDIRYVLSVLNRLTETNDAFTVSFKNTDEAHFQLSNSNGTVFRLTIYSQNHPKIQQLWNYERSGKFAINFVHTLDRLLNHMNNMYTSVLPLGNTTMIGGKTKRRRPRSNKTRKH